MFPAVFHPWIAVGVTAVVFVVLQVRRGTPTDVLFLGGMLALTLAGVLTPEAAIRGFANPAILAIGGLLVVTAGLRSTGVMDWVGRLLLGRVFGERQALRRLTPLLIGSSAFLLNTAVVAMMMPVVIDWCRRRGVSPSRLLLPLSYLAILGGVCTLIGTSTTLVVNGLLQQLGVRSLGFFEIGWVGLPCALVGGLLLVVAGPRLLPNRLDILEQLGEQRREYLVEMLVQPECPLIGRTVEDAGLRHLPGLFLIEINREGDVITPVTPQDVIHAADRLIFTGVVSTIVDLEKIPGLVPAADMTYEFHPSKRTQRHLTEVVLSRTSPLIGTTVREANFRQLYNAAVVAVHRNGVRLTNKVGSIELEPGDTLLLQTRSEFVRTYRNSRDFYLVSAVDGWEPRRHHMMRVAGGLGVLLVVWLALTAWLRPWGGWGSPAVASLTVAVLMIVCRCLRGSEARAAIDLQMLFTIAAALGLGQALSSSGAAQAIAETIVDWAGQRPYLLMICLYVLTVVFTETITNSAVAAMLLPIALAMAEAAGYSERPFIMAITLAASLSFLTPIGYQTNLMVMGPGGYRPWDYVRCGLPLAIAVGVTALILIPLVFPFSAP